MEFLKHLFVKKDEVSHLNILHVDRDLGKVYRDLRDDGNGLFSGLWVIF